MPSKLTDALIDELCTYVENGLTNKDAASMCMVTEQTLYKWLRDAEIKLPNGKPDPKYKKQRQLKEALEKAKTAFKAYHVQAISRASRLEWTASAWLLERKFPEEFGRVDRNTLMQAALSNAVQEDDGLVDAIRAAGEDLADMMGDEPEDV